MLEALVRFKDGNLIRPISKRQIKIVKYAARVWGKEGSGILLIAGDKVLLQFRSGNVQSGNVWSVPGGAVKGTDGWNESEELGNYRPVSLREAFDSAVTEFKEEGLKKIGVNLNSLGWVANYVNMKDHFRYITFVVKIPEDVAEKMEFREDDEVSGWKWFRRNDLPGNLHPGFKDMINSNLGKEIELQEAPNKKVEPND